MGCRGQAGMVSASHSPVFVDGGGPQGADGVDEQMMRASQLWSHCFRECPIARAVTTELASALPAGITISCANIWLLQAPDNGGLHADVWALVCMVAIEAMFFGRKAMWAMHLEDSDQLEIGQALITDFFPIVSGGDPSLSVVERASRKAAAWFWCMLQDFVCLGQAPWKPEVVGSSHPFLGFMAGTLRLNLPPGVCLPDRLRLASFQSKWASLGPCIFLVGLASPNTLFEPCWICCWPRSIGLLPLVCISLFLLLG